jgi:hypothetical protein
MTDATSPPVPKASSLLPTMGRRLGRLSVLTTT